MNYEKTALQHVDILRIEDQMALVAHLIHPLVLGIGIRQLDQSAAYHDVVVLVAAHEAGEDDLTGQSAFLCQSGGLRAQDNGVVPADLHTGNRGGVANISGHVDLIGITYGSVLLMNLVTKYFGTSRKIKEGK